ncbi:MAG: RpiB/LacA/LacB family sugar-phosphate isomerase, partial [Tidjanibacter sp.]|nr:RpiB/LacA/LacB family sugar-phosphate isomerase [Tidjanibacter sp.]
SIAANKVKGVRCALCLDVNMAHLSRQHNDANVLAMGARLIDVEMGKAIVDEWLQAEFEGGRHCGRIDKISHYESR